MAVADTNYRFLYVDVGAEGGAGYGGGGTSDNCSLAEVMELNQVHLPPDDVMPNDNAAIPFHFVADDAFPMKAWMMKP